LNTIVAKQLKDFKIEVDALIESKDMKKDDAIFSCVSTSKFLKYPFEGDGYSEAWEAEAEKRLSNFKTTPEALKARASKQAFDLFSEMGS
jgi:glutamine synthetase